MAEYGPVGLTYFIHGRKYCATFRLHGLDMAEAWDPDKQRCLNKLKEKVLATKNEWHDKFSEPANWPGQHYKVNAKTALTKDDYDEYMKKRKGKVISEKELTDGEDENEDMFADEPEKKSKKRGAKVKKKRKKPFS